MDLFTYLIAKSSAWAAKNILNLWEKRETYKQIEQRRIANQQMLQKYEEYHKRLIELSKIRKQWLKENGYIYIGEGVGKGIDSELDLKFYLNKDTKSALYLITFKADREEFGYITDMCLGTFHTPRSLELYCKYIWPYTYSSLDTDLKKDFKKLCFKYEISLTEKDYEENYKNYHYNYVPKWVFDFFYNLRNVDLYDFFMKRELELSSDNPIEYYSNWFLVNLLLSSYGTTTINDAQEYAQTLKIDKDKFLFEINKKLKDFNIKLIDKD